MELVSNFENLGLFKENFPNIALNSFQQSGILSPFSRFIIMSDISFCGLRQSMKSASLIFRFLQCGSDKKFPVYPIDFRVSVYNMLCTRVEVSRFNCVHGVEVSRLDCVCSGVLAVSETVARRERQAFGPKAL